MLLQGKTALIIGGSRGIGKAVAEEFLKEGAQICVAGRDFQTLIKIKNELDEICLGRKIICDLDVRIQATIIHAVNLINKHIGAIDIMVNAAGIHGEVGLFSEGNADKWEEAIGVNLIGAANAMRAVMPQMIKKGYGKIINFSGGGATSPRPRFSSYAASKTAVVRLTETVAEEMREKGISVDINAIAPGAINTRLVDEIIATGSEKAGQKEYELALLRKKEGGNDPKKAAALAVFLASHLSNGLSGRLISAVWDNWREIPKYLPEIMNSDVFTLRRVTPKERGYGW